jgi:hypothetical protein
MGHTDTKWITGLAALEDYVLRSPHIVIRQLKVKFRPSNGEYFDMSYEAIEKSNAHVRPQPEEFFRISKKQYLMLMRSIGDSQNVESTCLQFSPSDKLDSVFSGFFLSCIKGLAELCRALCTNTTMSTLQIQLSDKTPDKGFQDQVTLVRPLTTASDGQQPNVDLAKLNVTISGSRMCGAAVCDLVFHEVLQSSTLKELTVETLDHCGDMREGSRSYALLRAVVRPLTVDEAGQQAKANLTKLTLALPSVRENGTSRAIFAEILPELLQRNSTLKELTVKAPHFYEEMEKTREEKLCALLQPLKENKSLEILNLSECQGILTHKVIPTLMDILLVNFTLRDINFGDSSIWYSVKEQLRKNEKYMQSCLTKLPVAKAQAARVFLCGGPYAGMCYGIGVILHMLCHT